MVDEAIKRALSNFDIKQINAIEQIYQSAWKVNDQYILKRNQNIEQLKKSIAISELLLNENVPVAKFLRTEEDKAYITIDDYHYCLMNKLSGQRIDPYIGNYAENGLKLGRIVANLHVALKKIEPLVHVYDSWEFSYWIMDEITDNHIFIRQDVMDHCISFVHACTLLPKQLVHGDIHLGNLLFEGDDFMGYLDFDLSQQNLRLLDICYLCSYMLIGIYHEQTRIPVWREIIKGVIAGYEEITPLLACEKQAFPDLFVLNELTCVAFFSKSGQIDRLLPSVDMTHWIYENLDKLQIS